MSVVRVWLRAAARSRWRAWIAIGLIVGTMVGGVVAALAGAARTDTANARFLRATRSWDLAGALQCGAASGEDAGQVSQAAADRCTEALRSLPSVAAATTVHHYGAQFADVDGATVQPVLDTCYQGPGTVLLAADPSGRLGRSINRQKIVEGRAPSPSAAREVMVPLALARRLDLRPGDRLRAAIVSYERCLDTPASFPEPTVLEVVGIGVAAHETPPSSGFYVNLVTATPAFADAAPADALDERITMVRLRGGATARERFRSETAAAGLTFETQLDQRDHAADLQRAVDPSVQALRILGLLLALTGAAVCIPLLRRQTAVEAADLPGLAAIGASPRTLIAAVASWSIPVAVVAIGTAAVVSSVASAWTPIGLARAVEPDPGLSVDVGLLLLGCAATALVVVLAAVSGARPATRRGTPRATTGGRRALAALTRTSLPPSAVVGGRLALERGGGRSRVPIASGLVSITVGLVAIAASVTFGASLEHLLETPRLTGWNWDERISYPYTQHPSGDDSAVPYDEVIRALDAQPGIADYAVATIFPAFPGRPLQLGERRLEVPSLHLGTDAGHVGPSLVSGRAPVRPDEIVLGPVTADALDLDIGDRVRAYGQTGSFEEPDTFRDVPVDMDIVGIGVIPQFAGRLGEGAVTSLTGLRHLAASAEPDSILVRLAPDADIGDVVRSLARAVGARAPSDADIAAETAFDSDSFGLDVRRVDRLPILLAGLMAITTLAVLAHVLVSSTTAHRHQLALLRAIGFDRRHARAVVAWQALLLTAIASAVGVPLGVALGRTLWSTFATRQGAVPELVAPTALLVVVPLVLLASRVVAGLPARRATRGAIAERLRAV